MNWQFIPLDYDSIVIGNQEYVRIFGKTSDKKNICVIDKFNNYFYVLSEDIIKIKEILKGKVEKLEEKEKNLLGEKIKAIKIELKNSENISLIVEELKDKKIPVLESDVNYISKYIIEKRVKPMEFYEVEGQLLSDNDLEGLPSEINCDYVVLAKKIFESKPFEYTPSVIAFDIEADNLDPEKGKILMLSIVSGVFRKVLTWKKIPSKIKEAEYVKDEKELIERFIEIIKERNPDFITGYFTDGFDFPYLRTRAEKNKIKFTLGLDNSNLIFSRGKTKSCKVTGRVHIDLYRFIENIISPTLQSEILNLNQVAKELIGEKKVELGFGWQKELSESQIEKYFLYNLQDSILAEKLFYKLWPNISELSKIVAEPLFSCSRASYSQLVERYILQNLSRFNELAMPKPEHKEIEKRKERPKYAGAYVKQPEAGLFENIVVFDFASIYPSIIASFNISLSTISRKKIEGYETPEFEFESKPVKFYFHKKKGFIPIILEELIEKRKQIKKELKRNHSIELEARSYALKTLANATYGYFGFFGARYYCVECAASTTAIGRYYIQKVIKKAEENGFKVLYSDTDSIAITLENKTKKEALEFLKKMNNELPGIMEIDLENFYERGIFVTKRTGEFGAKKKYALISGSKLKIRGFETVRRDWCDLARELQNEVLKKVLSEGNPHSSLKLVKEVIKQVKSGKVEKSKLVIRTSLKKPISEYENIGPHVVAAKRMIEKGIPIGIGSLIEYYISNVPGKKLVRERIKLPEEEGEYDKNYYIENQILPAVENIFQVFGIKKEEIVPVEQKKLGEF